MADVRLTTNPAPQAHAAVVLDKAAREDVRRSFLRLASHELRTPLNAIIGFSEIIAQELYGPMAEPRYREHAAMVAESGHRLLKLVTQVLDIARLELGAMELDLRPEAVAPLLAAAARAVGDEAAAAQVTVSIQVAPGADWVRADARALDSALHALLQNAIAASPAGGRIGLEAHICPDGRVALEVADEGPGIAADQITRLLRPFEQGGEGLTRPSGSGLGLPVTRLLCEAMSGQLRLRPGPTGGLVAAVRLPACPPPEFG